MGTRATSDKSVTEYQEKLGRTQNIGIGAWNVRTLKYAGGLALVIQEINRYQWDIVGLSETRWKGKGEFYTTVEGLQYKVLCSGRDDEISREEVALLLNQKAAKALIGYQAVSSRIIMARFTTKFCKMTVIQTYAPTSDSTEEVIDSFYGEMQQMVSAVPKHDILIITGDWNAKVGTDYGTWGGTIGKHGIGEENDRGERLLNFCASNKLSIMNTFFEKRQNKKWTWESPDGKTKNLIDYNIINRRWKTNVLDVRTCAAEIGSDHKLVMSKIKMRLRKLHVQGTK